MDGLYLGCVLLAGSALVLISAVVPWGVFTRYVLNSASSWPEAMAILLSIVLTFFGAAACYRLGLHMRVSFVRDHLPRPLARIADVLSELLMLLVGGFMTVHGTRLCATTWNQSIAEFPSLSVGVTYLPIPLGGICLMLFVTEHLLIGRPADTTAD
jgi:TRAP-type C4-dicarboxylate transport system permease small subunit